MGVRNIKKQLAGVEDLLLGEGTQVQERNSGSVPITKINLVGIVDTVEALATLDITKYTTAIVKDPDRGGTFIWSATGTANGGTVFEGVIGYWNRQYSGAVNVKWFGAKGDGITDDTVAIQSAITSSKHLEGNEYDTYLLTQPIVKTQSCSIDFKGATLDFSNLPIDSSVDYFSILGSEDSEIDVTVDVAFGSKTITVANASSFSQGDMIRIGSDGIYDANSTNQPIGEILTIDSVSGNTITTIEPTNHIYLMSDNAFVSKLNMLENVVVKNFSIIGAGHGGVDRTQHGLVVKKCKNPQIVNIHTNYVDRIGIQIADCVGFLVDKCSASNVLNSGSGYGISVLDACQDGIVRGFVSENTRHTTSTNNTTAVHGIPRRIKFVGCVGKNSINAGDVFDTHTAAEDIHFEDCHVLSSSSQGFNIECRSATLVRCSTDNTMGNGISAHNESDYFGSISISDVRVLRSGGVGVKITNPTRGSNAQYKNVTISNITIDTTAGTGLYINSSIANNVENITISNVLISNVNAINAMYLLKTKNSVLTNIVINGTALNTTGLRVSDGKNMSINNVVFNLVENSPTSCIYLESTGLNGTNCVLVDNVSVNAPVNTNSFGIRVLENTKNVLIGKNLNISECKVLINTVGLTAGSYIDRFEYKTTILAGAIDYVSSAIEVDTEGVAPTDDLTTINGGKAGDILILTATNPSRVVNVVTGTGNIRMKTNFILNDTKDSLTLINNGGFWIELSRADYN